MQFSTVTVRATTETRTGRGYEYRVCVLPTQEASIKVYPLMQRLQLLLCWLYSWQKGTCVTPARTKRKYDTTETLVRVPYSRKWSWLQGSTCRCTDRTRQHTGSIGRSVQPTFELRDAGIRGYRVTAIPPIMVRLLRLHRSGFCRK